MPSYSASSFHGTLIGPVPQVTAPAPNGVHGQNGSSSANLVEVAREFVRTELVHVPVGNGGRRRLVITEQTELLAIDPRRIPLRWPTSPQARSYRLLRHRLSASSDPRVVAVTSAGPAEGKTTCALNLALAMAEEAMVRVLLVEANPLRPSFAEVFDLKSPSSLNAWTLDAMSGTWPISVVNVAATRLDIAASCFGSQGLDRLLFGVAIGDLRDAYDYVVLDTPSVLESGDANVAAACADGVIVTALATQSRRAALRRCIDQLSPATILGVVLLDV
jgi:Mrp family chromosome partitioning ATPase